MRLSDAEFDAGWMRSLETIFMRACRAVKLCTHALWYRSSGVPCMRAERSRLRAGVRERACARVRVVCAHGEGEDTRKESACRSICARGRRMMPPPPHSSHWNRSGKNGGGPSARNAALGRGTCANAAGNTPKHVRALTWRVSASEAATPLALLRGVSVLRVSLFESTWRGLSRYPVGSVATSFEQANLGKKPVASALLH